MFTLLLDAIGQAIEFHDEHRAGIEREAEVIRLLNGLRDELIHHLQRAGHNARADDFADSLAGVIHTFKNAEEGLERGWRFHQTHQHARDHAEHSLAADRRAAQVVAVYFLAAVRLDAEPFHGAIGQHHFVAEHVIGGNTILERVRPAGVRGHVAADGAGGLAGRIGREK